MICRKTSLILLFWKYPRFRSSVLCYIHRDKVCMWQSFFFNYLLFNFKFICKKFSNELFIDAGNF